MIRRKMRQRNIVLMVRMVMLIMIILVKTISPSCYSLPRPMRAFQLSL